MTTLVWTVAIAVGVGLVVGGAETFAEHLAAASVRLGVSSFALALLLAGAEPEELATAVAASLRHAPAIALGDVIGANLTACLVALGVGAVLVPVPFGPRVRRYALLGLPVGALAVALAWDGRVGRAEGLVLVLAYALYVGIIWAVERRPPSIGEAGEIEEARVRAATASPSTSDGFGSSGVVEPPESTQIDRGARSGDRSGPRAGRDVAFVLGGVVAMACGATLLVEAVRRLSGVEETQARLSLSLVGFATGFELVVLAWSAARRGMTDAVVAAVVGSFAYNATMTLGAGALARPLAIADAGFLHLAWLLMVAALALVVGVAAWRGGRLDRPAGIVLLAAYPAVLLMVLL